MVILTQLVREMICDNVCCCVMVDRVIGSFFFVQQTVNATIYEDKLELYAYHNCLTFNQQAFFNKMVHHHIGL